MRQRVESVTVSTRRGLNEITDAVARVVAAAKVREGLCTVFIRHTSASLVIQENADPAVQRDLEAFLSRFASASARGRASTCGSTAPPLTAGRSSSTSPANSAARYWASVAATAAPTVSVRL